MLSVPLKIRMERGKRRNVYLVINNKEQRKDCFCINPHLRHLDGSLEKEGVKLTSWKDADVQRIMGSVDDTTKDEMGGLVPRDCYEDDGVQCTPNRWFTARRALEIDGGTVDLVRIDLGTPGEPQHAPVGTWSFTVDTCIYSGTAPCDACEPENCYNGTNEPGYRFHASEWINIEIVEGTE